MLRSSTTREFRHLDAERAEYLKTHFSQDPADPLHYDSTGTVEGYFEVRSPIRNRSSGYRWAASYDEAEEPIDFGFVSLRHSDKAVTSFIDGHVSLLGERELTDMRYWPTRKWWCTW